VATSTFGAGGISIQRVAEFLGSLQAPGKEKTYRAWQWTYFSW
jgi:hypothetical protein